MILLDKLKNEHVYYSPSDDDDPCDVTPCCCCCDDVTNCDDEDCDVDDVVAVAGVTLVVWAAD